MRSRLLAVALFGALSLTAAACGSGGKDVATPGDDGVIEVTMLDNRYEPDELRVKAGEKVKFRFENDGAVVHEAYIADEDAQQAHAREMNPTSDTPGHDMDMDTGASPTEPGDGSAEPLRVEPGKSGTIERTFDQPGTFLIGCHEPGHWESGMRASIEVT